MGDFSEEILFNKNRKRFEHIKDVTSAFTTRFVGNNIIQDDIFTVIENYANTKEMPLEWIRIPIEDNELCACTFIRCGRIFVMLNTDIPLAKQIFAAAHELYHIRCYLEENDSELERAGSILDSRTIDDGTTLVEEMEANAFAGLLLASGNGLEQQIKIFRIDRADIGIDDVLTLMDIFAIPYKAMVLRLMEEQIISEEKGRNLLALSAGEVKNRVRVTGKAKRWFLIPKGNETLGSITENIAINSDDENVPEDKLKRDIDKLNDIKKRYGIE